MSLTSGNTHIRVPLAECRQTSHGIQSLQRHRQESLLQTHGHMREIALKKIAIMLIQLFLKKFYTRFRKILNNDLVILLRFLDLRVF